MIWFRDVLNVGTLWRQRRFFILNEKMDSRLDSCSWLSNYLGTAWLVEFNRFPHIMAEARNPSSALLSRIRDAKNGNRGPGSVKGSAKTHQTARSLSLLALVGSPGGAAPATGGPGEKAHWS